MGIIVAAGKGTRFGGDLPKQFIEVGGHPLLFYSLKVMQESFLDEIIVVTGEEWVEYVKRELVERFSFSKVSRVIKGGKERSDSVYAGLCLLKDPSGCFVYIHDAARPMLSADILDRVREGVTEYRAVIAAVPSKDTVKIVKDGVVVDTPDRSTVQIVQTPQAFAADELIAAYDRMFASGTLSLTDDAGVMEKFGKAKVRTVLGDYTNIKVTTAEDLKLAEQYLNNSKDVKVQ
ncbi:MAG: 2-C-methyl-D-erythritol 4-phosphate cytidylyltransferase [Lachnospiraceae bacterium]|nr:2-C-methyl-D-erythritol 4-phosphate cytidylyltransferase [Lachnospiraceae bacterium]